MSIFTLSFLYMVACSGDDKTDDGSTADGTTDGTTDGTDGTDTETAVACDITVDPENPSDGEPNFYIRDTIIVELDSDLGQEDSTASISLSDADGNTVDGTSSLDDDVLTFAPASALSPSTSYVATVSFCAGEKSADITFTTSSLGEELTGSVEGQTYALDLGSGTFLEPAALGPIIGSQINNKVLFEISTASDTELTLRGAISEENSNTQDYCSPTINDLPAADFTSSPYFVIPTTDITISISGVTVPLNSTSISGTFSADASYFGGGMLQSDLDARELGPLLGGLGLGDIADDDPATEENENAEAVCTLLSTLGVSCKPCGSDSQPYCVALHVVGLTAENTGEAMECVLEEGCHPMCNDNSCDIDTEYQECSQ